MAAAVRTKQAVGGNLIAGGGFAGAYVARLLGEAGATIVSPENFMLFTPMLPEAASGTLEPRHVVVPLRQMCPHAELLLGRVVALDEERRVVRVETDDAGDVRRRVRAVRGRARSGDAHAAGARPGRARARLQGPRRRDPPAQPRPAAARGCRRVARRRRARRSTSRSSSSAPATRASRPSQSSRISCQDALRFYPRLRGVQQRWVLVDAAPKVLPEIPTRLGDYAARELEKRGVEIRVGDDARVALRDRGRALERRADPDAHARLDGRRAGEPAPRASLGCRSTSAVASGSTRSSASRAASASGRSATAPRCRTRGRPSTSTRRQASTPSARRAGSRRTSSGEPERVRLPDARPGRDARPLQGHRRRHGAALPRLPGLVPHAAATTSTSCRS